MTIQNRDFPAISVDNLPKKEPAKQVGALCWRVEKGKVEVLLVTSRDTGRWVIPKGWTMKDKSDADAAATEAWEEAGVEGKLGENAVGAYAYYKVLNCGKGEPCVVDVYALKVKSLSEKFPEASERKRRWFTPKKAAARVDEPDLKALLRGFDPKIS